MPNIRSPRFGSMQVWPRKRSKRHFNRVRAWAKIDKALPLGFAGYKAGMTSITIIDNRKTVSKKGTEMSIPVTILECPPLKIASVRFYKQTGYGLKLKGEVYGKVEKELGRKIPIPKKFDDTKLASFKPEEYDDIRVNVYTQPKLTGIGKKKPSLFEIQIGGKDCAEKFAYAKENLGKEIFLKDVVSNGGQVDIHAVTKGKGFQGPVKRFGIGLKGHKSEKGRRAPGSLGGWIAQAHTMYRIAHAGQMGYHARTDYNKWIMHLGEEPEKINPKGGFPHYGFIKNNYVLLKGSVAGSSKRLIRFNLAIRPSKKIPREAPRIVFVNQESKQGN